ncbi:phosphatases II [Rhizodiscina lignyota]|uniref:Phosphatases II n=1 Tax=Rhizodiscina lignyota TaxID=1504668 RepID=A0A9P4IG79_9PEZI|nr:phosphatases II [Rhizodiscina lignyota]
MDVDGTTITEAGVESTGVLATNEYSFRVPSPTRIVIPPPSFTDKGTPSISFARIAPQPGFDLEFLNKVDYSHLFETNVGNNGWSYDKRRFATEILPFIYLGPMTAARDKDALKRDGITMILAVQHRSKFPSRMSAGPWRVATELGLEAQLIEVSDNTELIAEFPRAIRMINEHLIRVQQQWVLGNSNGPQMGKVLVFCESGNERSAAVVAAYLMHMFEGIDHIKACQVCNMRRFSTNFDDWMKQFLLSYWQIIQAQRDVGLGIAGTWRGSHGAHSNRNSIGTLRGRAGKRTFDDVGEDEDDMEMDDDAERFSGRNYAPFHDASEET